MAIILSGSTNDITVNGVSVATDTEVSTAVSLAVPVGTVVTTATTTALAGTLKCNGALISRTTYSALFAVIGTTFGVGDGSTTFALPDLRGEFIRGFDDGRGVDTGRTFGSSQNDAYLNHNHTTSIDGSHTHTMPFNRTTTMAASTTGTTRYSVDASTSTTSSSGGHTHTVNASTTGDIETRPKNIALLYCIKY